MATFDGFGNQIGAFGTPQAGYRALGRAAPRASALSAALTETGGAAAVLRATAPRVIVPTQQSAPPLVQGVNPEEGKLPTPVLVGAGVLGVALLGFLAFKLTR